MLATLVHFLMIDKLFSVLESLSVGKVVLGLVLLLDFSVYVLGIARHVQLQHKSMFVKFLRSYCRELGDNIGNENFLYLFVYNVYRIPETP